MDLLIRNVEPVAVKKIDELAKAKGISRNEFLKIYLENLSVLDSLKNIQVRFEEALLNVGCTLEKQQKEMADIKKLITHLSGIDPDELDLFYKEFGSEIVE